MPVEAFTGGLMLMASTRLPKNWLPCDGALYTRNEQRDLWEVIGQRYGTDGGDTFRVPDLRGRVPVSRGVAHDGLSARMIGQKAGADTAVLRAEHLPPHTHDAVTTPHTSAVAPGGTLALRTANVDAAAVSADNTAMEIVGQGTPVDITPAAVVMTWAICAKGMFPSPPRP